MADTLLQEQEDVVVSGEQLAHLDTSTLQILVALRQGLWSQGRSLQLTGMSAELENLLQLAGVKNVLYSQVAATCI
ncbi:MAG: STAS domain-containing protein [Pirellulaceae bacterium]